MKAFRPGALFLLLAALFAASVAPIPGLASELVCGVCGKAIAGRYVEEEGQAYHLECYEQHRAHRCAVCGKPILESRIVWEGKDYHADCYRETIQPLCAVCGKPIVGQYVVEGGKN